MSLVRRTVGPFLALAVLFPGAGCRGTTGVNEQERAALGILQEEYEPQEHQVDDKGRVIKLKLEGTHVDDAALEQVRNFKVLRDLSLARASVTDAGLAKVQGLKRLEALGLTDTRVTDKGLAMLQKMPSLRYVWVTEGRGGSPTGVEALKKALPGVSVYVMNSGPQSAEQRQERGE